MAPASEPIDGPEIEVSEDLRSLLSALAHAPSWPVEDLRIAPGDHIGRYALESVIGRGGFGVVFAARDEELGRRVAIKLTRGTPTLDVLGRFQREARLAASVNHPNVVTLHDSGTIASLPYLVLELLEGETLEARLARGPLAPRAALAIAADVLRALVEMHRAGIVHSDLKPSNVFLTADGRVKVLDFGLAQLRGDTADAMRAGTPGYMAPEQWRGEPTDARTDVFGVGVMLFAMVAGALPFASAELADERPARPLPRASVRLRAVVARALDKQVSRRYANAAELLAAVDAILARRRGKRLAAGLAALALAGGATALVVREVHARRNTVATARLAERAGREAEAIEAQLRFSRLQPLHDIRGDLATARARLAALITEVEEAGEAPDAAEVALARAERAVGELDGARARLEGILERGDRTPAAVAALGAVLLDQYELRLVESTTDPDLEHRAQVVAELDRTLRDPALRYLHAGADDTPYALARIALYEHHYEDARHFAGLAHNLSPGSYEAAWLAGVTYLQEASEAGEHGKFEIERDRAGRAEASFSEATSIARSDPALFTADCRHWNLAARAARKLHRDSTMPYHQAELACGLALTANPADALAAIQAAIIRLDRAEELGQQGGVPWPLYDETIAMLAGARAVHPTNASLPRLAGLLLLGRSYIEDQHDLDPRPTYEAAERALRDAWKLQPDGDAPDHLGAIEMLRAEYDLAHAIDPTAAVGRALELTRHRETSPRLVTIGRALTARGSWELAHGADPRGSLDAAIAAFQQARVLRPASAIAADEEGGAWQAKATWERRNGLDAAPSLDHAIEATETVLRLDPHDLVGHSNLGDELMIRAEVEATRHGDPEPFLRRALEHLEQAHIIDPSNATPLDNLGAARELEARLPVAAGHDPTDAIRAARRALAEAQAAKRDDLVVLPTSCALERDAAAWERAGGRSPVAAFARARAACEGALALDAKDLGLAEQAASLLREIAEWRVGQHADATTEIADGLRLVRIVIAATPAAPEARAIEAALMKLATPR